VVLPLRTWLAGSHAAVFLLPLAVVLGTGALGADLRNQTRDDIEHQAAILALHVASRLDDGRTLHGDGPALSRTLQQVRDRTLAGIQITDPSARVVASSGAEVGSDLSHDPDVAAALAGERSVSVRPRKPGRHALSSESRLAGVRLFVALPVEHQGSVVGAVVVSRTPREELQAMYHMAGPGLMIGWFAGLLVAIGVGAYFSVMLSRNLRRLDRGALQIAAGSFAGSQLLQRPTGSHVAEVARVASSVSTMADRLQERLGYIGEFASNVSHEFKTPLATLRGTVELLADDDEMPAEQRTRFLDNADRELVRLEQLVNGLLSLARADQEVPTGPVDLDALAAAACDGRPVTVRGSLGVTAGDEAQLQTVLLNLVDNALQHGGSDVSVTVAGLQPAAVGFEVCDDGVGISEANLPRVFDRFFTTDRAGGTGLGLALVRAVVRSHGGELTVSSRPGDTRFRVVLPPYRRSS
jgi:signal transduction histidine kinase